jgi:hypothetical protein
MTDAASIWERKLSSILHALNALFTQPRCGGIGIG